MRKNKSNFLKLLELALIFIVLSLPFVFARDIVFQNGDIIIDNALFVNSTSNKTGMGTNSPVYKFHINGTDTNFVGSLVENAYSDSYAMQAMKAGGNYIFGLAKNSPTRSVNPHYGWMTNSDPDGGIIIYTGGYTVEDERMRIDPNGSIGIGTKNPERILHINDSANQGVVALIENALDDTNSFAYYSARAGDGNFTSIGKSSPSRTPNPGYGWIVSSDPTAGLLFITGGSDQSDEKMRIEADGKVGIGATAPSHKLNVDGDANITGDNIIFGSDTTKLIHGENSNNYMEWSYSYNIFSTNIWSSHASGVSITMTDSIADSMTLTGADTVTVDADSQVKMPDVYSDTVGGTNRDLYIDDTGKLGYVSSALKYKTNIRDLTNASWIYDLEPKIYDRINSTVTDEIGLIAEDVELVNSKLVSYRRDETEPTTNEDGTITRNFITTNEPETVNYGSSEFITALLVEIQNQKAENDLLKTELCQKDNTYSWC